MGRQKKSSHRFDIGLLPTNRESGGYNAAQVKTHSGNQYQIDQPTT